MSYRRNVRDNTCEELCKLYYHACWISSIVRHNNDSIKRISVTNNRKSELKQAVELLLLKYISVKYLIVEYTRSILQVIKVYCFWQKYILFSI